MEILVVILVIIILTIMSEYNKVDNKRKKIKETWKTINSYLKQKTDYLTKIIETVMFKLNDNSELLEKIVSLKGILQSGTNTEKLYAHNKLTELMPLFKETVSNNDELSIDEHLNKLFNNIDFIDNKISDYKNIYNNAVDNYNILLTKFPSTIIADKFNFKEESHIE